MKVRKIVSDGPKKYMIFCPGCKTGHVFTVPPWTFNNDFNQPTLGGSILVEWSVADKKNRCHLTIADGQITFLNDCTHPLVSKVVPLEDF